MISDFSGNIGFHIFEIQKKFIPPVHLEFYLNLNREYNRVDVNGLEKKIMKIMTNIMLVCWLFLKFFKLFLCMLNQQINFQKIYNKRLYEKREVIRYS